MVLSIVLDTNVILYFLAGRLSEPLPPAEYYISVITEMELLSYPLLKSEEETEIHEFLTDVVVVDLNQEIKQSAVALRRKYRLKLPDAVVVATAQYLKAELFTNDLKILAIPLLSVNALPLRS